MKLRFKTVRILFFYITAVTVLCSLDAKNASAKPGDAYSADKAAEYADSCFKKSGNSYKPNPNKKYGEELCAGYVSQCLKEGGMTMDSSWYWKAIGKTSESWRVSRLLFSYLKSSGYQIHFSPKASDVQKGDVVFYWTNGGWGHVAICVGKTSSGKPMVNAYNDPHYHFSYWTMGYKTCVVSMDSRTAAPEIKQTQTKNGIQISLSSATEKAEIYYTTDGSTPTEDSEEYQKPVSFKKRVTIKAIAICPDYKESAVTSVTINAARPVKNGIYFLQPSKSDTLALSIAKAAKGENKAAVLAKKGEEHSKKVSVKYLSDGKYRITLLHSGYDLTQKKGDRKTKNKIVQKKYSAGQEQQWMIGFHAGSAYTISNVSSDAFLSAGKIKSGSALYTYKKQASSVQAWNFIPAVKSTPHITGANKPKTIKRGHPYNIRGTVSSNLEILQVHIKIINKAGKTILSGSAHPNAFSYSIRKANEKLQFGRLSAGTYTYLITAYDASRQPKTLVSKKFKVK